MARKPSAPSYAKFALDPEGAEGIPPGDLVASVGARVTILEGSTGGKTLKDVAKTHLLYLHPNASKTLQRYAVDHSGANEVKVHDLLIEAVQDWFDKHGLRGPIRALPKRVRNRG